MDDFATVEQHLRGSLAALKRGDYELVDSMAERILSNVLLMEEKTLYLPGLFLKEVAEELKKYPGEGMVKEAERFITEMLRLLEREERNPRGFWDLFVEYERKVRPFKLKETERGIYVEDETVSLNLVERLLSLVREQHKYLYADRSRFVEGILSEIESVLTLYGGTEECYIVYIYLKVLRHLFRYLYYESCTSSGEFRADYLKGKILDRVKRFLQIHTELRSGEEYVKMMNNEILQNTSEWRRYVLFYKGSEVI